jgi:hypothetical protein
VIYYHLIARGTVDEHLYRVLAEREDIVEAVLEALGKGETEC